MLSTFDELELELLQDPDDRHIRRDVMAERAFIAKLVERRRELGLSRRAVAEHMHITKRRLRKLESGQADMRMSTVSKWTHALGWNFTPTAVSADAAEKALHEALQQATTAAERLDALYASTAPVPV